MKNYIIIGLSILVVILYLLKGCNKPIQPKEIIDNTKILDRVERLKNTYDKIKQKSKKLEVSYDIEKKRKDSIVYKVKYNYIMAYDSLSEDTIECLPKPHVDSLVDSFEYLLIVSDDLILSKQNEIDNLEEQNNLKDTVIVNCLINEETLKKTLRREKRKKWKFGIGGAILGFAIGKTTN